MRAQILTSATPTGWGVTDAHPLPQGASCMDVTGQPHVPAEPNALVVEVWYVPPAWPDAVEAAEPGSVLWSEGDPSDAS